METFKENGSYNKTEWEKGDIITSEKLNKIEDALYEINENSNDVSKLDLSNYATKDEVPKRVSELTNDMDYVSDYYLNNNYARKSDLPYKMSQLTNDTKFITINHEHDNYMTKNEYPTIPTNISAFYNDVGYITRNHYHSNYALKTDIPIVPTKVSDLINDMKYVTESHSHTIYALKTDIPVVPTKVSDLINDMKYVTDSHTHENYANKTDIPVIPTRLSQFNNDAGYVTVNHNHDNYMTKNEIPDIPTKMSQLQNDSGYINYIPAEYITESELDSKQYANKDYVINAINNAQISGGTDGSSIDLSIYATKSDIANKADKGDIPTTMSQLINDSGFLTAIPDEYITNNELIAKEYVDKSYVDNAIDNAQIDIDLSAYALKKDIPTIPTNVSAFTNDIGYALRNDLSVYALRTEIPSLNGYARTSDLESYALKIDVPTKTSELANDSRYLTSNSVIRVEIVTEYPPEAEQEENVLYVRVSE